MNCDEVFEILTRGPFPTGDPSDVDVELHLGECSSCQELAEALRPALELFEEAIPAAESRNLPGYWGDQPSASTVAAEVARSAFRTRPFSNTTSQLRAWVVRWASGPAALLMATVAMGLSIGVVAWIVGSRSANTTPSMDLANSRLIPMAVVEDKNPLANRQLPVADELDPTMRQARFEVRESCLRSKLVIFQVVPTGDAILDPQGPSDGGPNFARPASDGTQERICCTQCHHSGAAGVVPESSLQELVAKCNACHGGK